MEIPGDWPRQNPVVFLHGFSKEAIFEIVKAVKNAAEKAGTPGKTIAFASSTINNMEWKIRKLIREVTKEHEAMRRKEEEAGASKK
ncbi:MAG: DUF3783 domain-containing protein [Treponema sp.]|jgi:hypothetical protein|nr:DUF3783 domain-containing protein [Treponema sp.]